MQLNCTIYTKDDMIQRQMTEKLAKLASQFPVVGVIGPRQSGKTTLTKATFSKYAYVTLEDIDIRLLALQDPRRFFATYGNEHGLIIDEVQEAPDLLSYMQGIVDQEYKPGYFIVTGSQNFLMLEKISQTLAGRIALLTLLPLTVDELKQANQLPKSPEELLLKGLYPRVYNQPIDASDWFLNYIATYLERDVRQIIKVTDLVTFQRFLKLCAGRNGQLLNYTALADDCSISPNTARAWVSLLETSYIVHLVQPYYKNFNKRIIKTPKLYFYDTGIVCCLLEIKSVEQLQSHYARGAIFEAFAISELAKYRLNAGDRPNLYFWRDVGGHEIDCLLERSLQLIPIEIKSGMTVNTRYFNALDDWNKITGQDAGTSAYVVYAGENNQKWPSGQVTSWKNMKKIIDETNL